MLPPLPPGAVVVGVGVDAVDIARMRETLGRTPTFAARVFTSAEREYAERAHDPTERYAVRFAAKEAVMKALGLGLGHIATQDIEVVRDDEGRPSVVLHGKGAATAAGHGATRWLLTLTHTELVAIAVAIALGEPSGVIDPSS